MKLTESVRSFHVPETPRHLGLTAQPALACPPPGPSASPGRRTYAAVATIVLTVFFSSSISPRALTVTFCDRSPLATAVVTWAMSRTWPVRLRAMLTESVRSFQVPATPGTSAWPPSRPSMPTSRATRVTSSDRTTELVHHRVDGVLQLQHLAGDVDGDLLRQVTLADRGGHQRDVAHLGGEPAGRVDRVGEVLPGPGDPAAPVPGRRACPSAPTSLATRVTSEVNSDSWLTILFTVRAIRRNSPRIGWPSISSSSVWDRSPWATAAMTRPTSAVGRTRSSTRLFAASMLSFQAALTRPGPRAARTAGPHGRPRGVRARAPWRGARCGPRAR